MVIFSHHCLISQVYYSIREIIRNNGWSKTKVDELFSRLDSLGKDDEISKSDRTTINVAVGKWLYATKGR